MVGDRPISLMFKPAEPTALEIQDRRRLLGIAEDYGWQRFHISFLPLGEGRHVSAAFIARVEHAVRLAALEPVQIELGRLNGNALVVGKGKAAMCQSQARLVRELSALGIPDFGYTLRPHLSLTYGKRSNRTASFAPIRWTADRLFLIRSIHGEGRHEPLCEWLLQPRQRELF